MSRESCMIDTRFCFFIALAVSVTAPPEVPTYDFRNMCFVSTYLGCRKSHCQAGETIRQAAERTAQQVLLKTATRKGQRDDVAQLHFVGNCPAGWFWRTTQEQERPNGIFGDKVNRAFDSNGCR